MDSLPVMVGKRLVFGVVTLIAISLMIAVGVELLPGDLAQAILGPGGHAGDGGRLSPRARPRPALAHPLHHVARQLHDRRHGHLARQQARDLRTHRHPARAPTPSSLRPPPRSSLFPLAVFLGMLAALYRETLFDKMISMTTLSHDFLSGVLRRLHPHLSCSRCSGAYSPAFPTLPPTCPSAASSTRSRSPRSP